MHEKLKCLKILKFIIVTPFCVFGKLAKSQNRTLSGDIFEYATYYISSFDFNTGATNVQIFRYELSSDQYPASVKIKFNTSMISPALGINNEQVIISLKLIHLKLLAPLVLDNRDLSSRNNDNI